MYFTVTALMTSSGPNSRISSNSVNTKPQLEIYADDVKCSHGATIGKLNEDEQFYMRSRGISLAEARFLQMISFVSPVFELVPEETELAPWEHFTSSA